MKERLTFSEPRWENTHDMVERLRVDPNFEEPDMEAPAGIYRGRRIISRDSRISGGVYVGSGAREAIVVDPKSEYRHQYERIYSHYSNAVHAIVDSNPDASVLSKILMPAFAIVRQALPFNNEAVEYLTRSMSDKKVNLGHFLDYGAGVCRHQALAVGYLLERFQDEGQLMAEDRISIDRNTIPGKGGHAWVRFTASDGTTYIIDPAQGRVDRLAALQDVYWDYRRPAERL